MIALWFCSQVTCKMVLLSLSKGICLKHLPPKANDLLLCTALFAIKEQSLYRRMASMMTNQLHVTTALYLRISGNIGWPVHGSSHVELLFALKCARLPTSSFE